MLKGRLFAFIWLAVFVLYLTGVALYGVLVNGYPVSGVLTWLARAQVLGGAGLVALLMTIPLFQFLLSAQSRAYTREVVRPHSDSLVLPSDAEDHARKERRREILRRQNELSIKLWMLFVVLMSLIGMYLMFYTRSVVEVHDVQSAVTDLPPAVLTEPATPAPVVYAPLDLPKFGGIDKTDEQKQADAAYVAGMLEKYGTTQEALAAELQIGWNAFYTRASTTAMHSFNRAWLLSATSSDALWGMGLVEGVRGRFDQSIALLREATTFEGANPAMHCDIARSYLNKSVLHADEAPDLLTKAMGEIQQVESAQAMTPACYKTAAKIARAEGDEARAVGYEAYMTASTTAL